MSDSGVFGSFLTTGLFVAVCGWIAFGNPTKDIANTFYKNDAAPWEKVDAFYYPDPNDLTVHQSFLGADSVAGCRSAVSIMAYPNNSPLRGDYECGVGKLDESFAGLAVYRLTVK